jgi:hypothetical protein
LGLATLTFCLTTLAVLAVHFTGFTICHFDYLIPYAEIFIRTVRFSPSPLAPPRPPRPIHVAPPPHRAG